MTRHTTATRRLRVPVAIALIGGALSGSAGEPARADRPSVVTLAGTNVIRGSAPSVAHVRIPRDAEIDLIFRPRRERGPTSSVSIAGAGRAVGIALTEPAPGGLMLGTSKFLLSGRFATCPDPGCASPGDTVNFQWPAQMPEDPDERWQELPAGDYRLFLIADEAPVTITLRLRGLDGTRVIRPTVPTPLDLKTPTVRLSHSSGATYYSAGDTFDAGPSRGLALTMLSVKGPKDAVWAPYSACAYWGGPTKPPDEAAYGPHCSAAGNMWVSAWESARRFDLTFLQGYDGSSQFGYDGTRGQGVWLAARNSLERISSQIFTLPVD